MKEDVLEQVVDDYLQLKGYFTTHNVRFRPDPEHADFQRALDQTPSDVDVVGYHPSPQPGDPRVMVVTCKAWQTGFNATRELTALRFDKKSHGRRARSSFRELWFPKWSEAFHATVRRITGESTFAYRIAVTHLRGTTTAGGWADEPTIKANLRGCSFDFLALEEMWGLMVKAMTTTPASSEIGRLAQLLKAAGLTAPTPVAPPDGPVPGSDAAIMDGLEDAP